MFKKVYDYLVQGKEKAVVAFLITTATTYLAQSGLTLDKVFTKKGLAAVASGVLAHLVVYFTNNTATA